jgi:hypothetical protein
LRAPVEHRIETLEAGFNVFEGVDVPLEVAVIERYANRVKAKLCDVGNVGPGYESVSVPGKETRGKLFSEMTFEGALNLPIGTVESDHEIFYVEPGSEIYASMHEG